jgi:hypothetical protein
VVFREGFETVLFYQALGARAAGSIGLSAVASGFATGLLTLAAIATALFRYGVRIPIRPFFATTGALLYVLAVKFAGGGVRELQEAGWIGVTPVAMPDLPVLRDWLGVYPFLEPLLAQALLVLALVAGAVWTLLGRAAATVGGAETARPLTPGAPRPRWRWSPASSSAGSSCRCSPRAPRASTCRCPMPGGETRAPGTPVRSRSAPRSSRRTAAAVTASTPTVGEPRRSGSSRRPPTCSATRSSAGARTPISSTA